MGYTALTVFQRYRSALQKATHYPLSLASLLIEQGVLSPEVLRQVDERPSEERVVTLFTHICASLACASNEEVAQERLHKCLWAMSRLFPECDELIVSLKLAFYEGIISTVSRVPAGSVFIRERGRVGRREQGRHCGRERGREGRWKESALLLFLLPRITAAAYHRHSSTSSQRRERGIAV